MPDWLQVLFLGVIEGITEFLPISSTGHLLLAEQWLGARPEHFNVFIQSGAVRAVLAVARLGVSRLLVEGDPLGGPALAEKYSRVATEVVAAAHGAD